MLSKSFKFAACWDEGMWGWRGTETAMPTDLSAPWGWRGTREQDKHWVFKHTHTIFGLITQGWGGGLCFRPPCWHRAAWFTQTRQSFRFGVSQLQNSPQELLYWKNCSQASIHTPIFYAPTSSQTPSAQKLKHKILLKGITFLAGSSPPSLISKPLAFQRVQSFHLRAITGRKAMQPVGGRDVRGEAVEQEKESLHHRSAGSRSLWDAAGRRSAIAQSVKAAVFLLEAFRCLGILLSLQINNIWLWQVPSMLLNALRK